MDFPFSSRGLFWWSDVSVPAGSYAPESATPGTLSIADNGRTRLELDSFLGGGPHARFHLGDAGQDLPSIVGLLRDKSQSILLVQPRQIGFSLRFSNSSHDTYACSYALVSEGNAFHAKHEVEVKRLAIDLAGLEDWIWNRAIRVSVSENGLTIEAPIKSVERHQTRIGYIELSSFLDHPGQGLYSDATLVMHNFIDIEFSDTIKLDEALKIYLQVTELLNLLSNIMITLPYPDIWTSNDESAKLIYTRPNREAQGGRSEAEAVPISSIRDKIGLLICQWLEIRERFGAGVYLFTAVQPSRLDYLEHRFVNHVWGLESFHRTITNDAVNTRLDEKINRIIDDVKLYNDRKWLAKRFENGAEPNLSERLCDLITSTELKFADRGIRHFSKNCAELRNQISHFGGPRKGGVYREFMDKLYWHFTALNYLY